MISFKTFYTEAKQVGILYHYTTLIRLPKILNVNILGTGDTFVSFTRDKNFHRHERDGIVSDSARIVIDGDLLSHHYRVLPYNYFGDKRPHRGTWDEQEERVMINVTNLNKYIIKIQIFQDYLDSFFVSGLKRRMDSRYGEFVYFDSKEKFLEYLRQYCKVELI